MQCCVLAQFLSLCITYTHFSMDWDNFWAFVTRFFGYYCYCLKSEGCLVLVLEGKGRFHNNNCFFGVK